MFTIGIDIGGSKIAVGLLEDDRIVCMERAGFAFFGDPKGLVDFLTGRINSLCGDFAVESAGVGTPGWVVGGVVSEAVNIGIDRLDLLSELKCRVPVPVFVENDARTALLGEAALGALAGCRNAMMVTLGTGIGGAFLLDGRLYRGSFGCAGEIGHVSFRENGRPCCCGKRGCLELTASASALVRQARKLASAGKGSDVLKGLCRGKRSEIDGETVFRAAKQGDRAVLAILDRYTAELAHALGEVAYLLDLEAIAVGGGISVEEKHLTGPLGRKLMASGSKCRVVPAALGNNAGVIGAAMLGKMG